MVQHDETRYREDSAQAVRLPAPQRAVRGALIALLLFGALSSIDGAVMAIAFNGAGLPLEYLEGSPFDSYLVPGLILGVVVGGTQLAAAGFLMTRHPWSLPTSAIAGFGMIIWVFVELAMILVYSFLQTLYFGLAVLELILVLLLLGVVPRAESGTARTPQGPVAG
jgi:hypothetical protein